MLIELALAQAIRQSNPGLSEARAAQYAEWVFHEAHTNKLDPWLIQAIVHRETHWRSGSVRHENNGSCSVGLGQVNTRCDEASVQPLLNPQYNLHRVGRLLSLMRSLCKKDCKRLGWVRMYNPGSREYLAAIKEAVKNYHAQNGQPSVLRVQTRVLASRMLRESSPRTSHECRVDSGKCHSGGPDKP